MGITLLHLSDVHFGISDNTSEQSRIIDGINKYIKDNSVTTDFLVFTGDLAQKGLPNEFDVGGNWLSELAGLLEAKIILVPGNHDVDRTSADIDLLRLSFPAEESYLRQEKKIYKSHKHIDNYISWFSGNKTDVYLNNWSSNPCIDIVNSEKESISISFICINTALLSCDDEDEKRLCVDLKSLNSALKTSNTDTELVIAVGHHPLDWLVEWNSDQVKVIFNQEVGPHLYLHGHRHEASGKSGYSNSGEGIVSLAAGAAYQGSKWEQSFSIIEIDIETQKITPTIVEYSDASGTWDTNNQKSKSLPARLPTLPSQNESIKEIKSPIGKSLLKFDNPFDSVAANDIDAHVIPKLFVDENNFLNRITNKFDAVVEGQRGTGKTMLLRYLSIEVQRQLMGHNNYGGDLSNVDYIGIYCRVSTKGFTRTDFQSVKNKARRESLFNERLTLFFISCLMESMSVLIDGNEAINGGLEKIRRKLYSLLGDEEIKEASNWNELKDKTIYSCDELIDNLDSHVASLLPGGSPTEFNPRLGISTSYYSLLTILKIAFKINAPFFILIDDFDALDAEQQTIIFKSASERNHALICYKFGTMTFGRKTNLSGNARTYREGDDYDHIELIWLDKGLEGTRGSGSYKKTVLNIANRRIDSSNWPKDLSFQKLFEDWKKGNEIRETVKKEMENVYSNLEKNRRPKTFQNYYDKQGTAKYFQYLRKKKIEHRYAGQNTIIDVSSGIFRQFLEICSHIVTRAFDAGWTPASKKKIGIEIQSEAMKSYSNDMIKSIGETAGDTSSLSFTSIEVTGKHIVNLAESLSSLFYERLHSNVNDGEVIAVAIRGNIKEESFGKALLDVAVRESILHRRKNDYQAKTVSDGKLPTYVLNRRLVPRKNIGVKLQGRHELTIEDIEMAARSQEEFKKHVIGKMLGKPKSSEKQKNLDL